MTLTKPTRGHRPPADHAEPLLIDRAELARLLGRSVASIDRDDAAGRLPAALKLGASKKWRRAEILAWTEAGCPDRATWDAIQ
jgi:predicted DNA-binding transcriptional regulator AlpA